MPIVKSILSLVIFVFYNFIAQAQSKATPIVYTQAFAEQLQMLKGEKPINFKRAVFLTENAYNKGILDYKYFCNDISIVANQLKEMIRLKGIQNYKTAGNWAVFTYMTDILPINNFKPFVYDFDDFMGTKDWKKMFVTKLMKTHSGNCHSLPYYYKILAEEIGAKAFLALAPNHIYIKHLDEKNQWTNIELTNGGFPRDQWIIKEMSISVEAIKNNIYMAPLTPKESIVQTMFDLAGGYQRLYGTDSFSLKIVNTALAYSPKNISLLQTKANMIDYLIKQEKKKNSPNIAMLKLNIALYKDTIAKIDQLGYKDMPVELYNQWVKSVEQEKSKQLRKNN